MTEIGLPAPTPAPVATGATPSALEVDLAERVRLLTRTADA